MKPPPTGGKLLRTLDVLTVILFLGTSVSAYAAWAASRDTRQLFGAMTAASSPVGRKIDAMVVSDLDGTVQPLSDVAAGRCRFVVVGSRSCPYARAAAYRWMITALNDPAGATMPEGWEALWVSTDEITGRGEMFDSGFPTPTFFAQDRIAFIRSAGISHTPFQFILDRNGTVTAVDHEPRLFPVAAFQDDCTILTDSTTLSPPEVTPVTGSGA